MKFSDDGRRPIAGDRLINNVKEFGHLTEPAVRRRTEAVTQRAAFDRNGRLERFHGRSFVDVNLNGYRQHRWSATICLMAARQSFTARRIKHRIHSTGLVDTFSPRNAFILVRIKDVTYKYCIESQ